MKKSVKALTALGAMGSLSFAAYVKKAKEACNNQIINPEFLIILGYGIKDGVIHDVLKMRIEAAADFLEKNPDTVAIPTGGITFEGQTLSEAQAIKDGLMARGIPEERIILEDQAKTTVENFVNAKKIIQGMRKNVAATRIAFMTSDFHVYRASVICRQAGLEAVGIPAPSPEKSYKAALLREFVAFPIMKIEFMKGKNKNG